MRALISTTEVGQLSRPCNADASILSALISEAEREDVKPRIGDDLYIALKDDSVALTDELSLLLNGGVWTSRSGERRVLVGLKTALAYFVYARVIRDGNIQSTRFGAVVKNDEHSDASVNDERQRQYRQAFASADAYLKEVLSFINDKKDDYGQTDDKRMKSNRASFRVVGASGESRSEGRSLSTAGANNYASVIAQLTARVSSLETSVATLGRTKVDARYVDERVAPVRFTENSTYAEISEAYADGRSMLLDVSDDDLDVYAFSAYVDGIFYFSQITEGVIYVASYLEDEEPRFNSYNLTNN